MSHLEIQLLRRQLDQVHHEYEQRLSQAYHERDMAIRDKEREVAVKDLEIKTLQLKLQLMTEKIDRYESRSSEPPEYFRRETTWQEREAPYMETYKQQQQQSMPLFAAESIAAGSYGPSMPFNMPHQPIPFIPPLITPHENTSISYHQDQPKPFIPPLITSHENTGISYQPKHPKPFIPPLITPDEINSIRSHPDQRSRQGAHTKPPPQLPTSGDKKKWDFFVSRFINYVKNHHWKFKKVKEYLQDTLKGRELEFAKEVTGYDYSQLMRVLSNNSYNIDRKLCYLCRNKGHKASECPDKGDKEGAIPAK